MKNKNKRNSVLNENQTFNIGAPGGSEGKESACSAGSVPGSGLSPGEGNGNPFQYSCLENPMDGGAWQAKVYGVKKSQTRLCDFTKPLIYILLVYYILIY